MTELLITVGFLFCYMKYGFGDMYVLLTLLIVAATILGVVDTEHQRIPSKILISTLLIAVIYRTFIDKTFYGTLYGGLFGAVIGLAIRHVYFILKGQKEIGYDYTQWKHEDRFVGPGFDYVKLLAITGVFLPLVPLLTYVFNIGIICLLWRLIHPKSFRPGAIMATGLTLYVLYPGFTNVTIKILSIL